MVTAFGILNIVMAVLFLGCGSCGGLQAAASTDLKVNNRDVSADYQAHMRREVPAFVAEKYADLALRFLMALALVASCIGLLMMHRWAHALALLTALGSLLHQLVVLVWQFVFIVPAQNAFWRTAGLGDIPGFFTKFDSILVVGWAALVVLFNLGMIAALVVPSSLRAFWSSAAAAAREEEPDYDDED